MRCVNGLQYPSHVGDGIFLLTNVLNLCCDIALLLEHPTAGLAYGHLPYHVAPPADSFLSSDFNHSVENTERLPLSLILGPGSLPFSRSAAFNS